MNGIQILGNLAIWAIFRAPAAREEILAIFALRNHHFVFKNPKKNRAPVAREEKIHILPLEMMILCSKITKKFAPAARKKTVFAPCKSWFCVQNPHFFRAYGAFSSILALQTMVPRKKLYFCAAGPKIFGVLSTKYTIFPLKSPLKSSIFAPQARNFLRFWAWSTRFTLWNNP